jgi:hypothetical protein
MEAFLAPRGLIIDLITPLNKDGDIDGDGLGRHLERVLPHVQALFLASPYVGEGKNLASTQREELLEKSLLVVQGRVPILIWISQDTEEKTSETGAPYLYRANILGRHTPLLSQQQGAALPLRAYIIDGGRSVHSPQ